MLTSRGTKLRPQSSALYALLLGLAVAAVSARMPGVAISLTDLDGEIDYLSSIAAKQQVAAPRHTGSPPGGPRQRDLSTPPPPTTGRPSNTSHQPPKPVGIGGGGPSSRRGPGGPGGPGVAPLPIDGLLVVLISVCVIVGTVVLILAAVCWMRFQREAHQSQKVDYPAWGERGPAPPPQTTAGDRTLAQCAQMYHYKHQKQQMLSMERHHTEPRVSMSGVSDEETEEGDFTVYECPGLAPTGEMEVKNPLFDDSSLQHQRNHK